jgi:murein DD-endopeptidase MepM/ murein hydrolase activator NlpD
MFSTLIRRFAIALPLVTLNAAAWALPTNAPVPGGVAVLRVGDASAPPPRAWFRDQPVLVARDGDAWFAVVGLPLNLEPGRYSLKVSTDEPDGRRSEPFTVEAKEYPAQHVTIRDKRKVTPSALDMERIEREQKIIAAVKHHWRDEPRPDLALRLPASGPLSSRFGLRRYFNGQARNPHSGLDVAVGSGTPVVAAANGIVANTGDYFFNGNTVFVDHGQGLITMYCHLRRIDVKPGEPVAGGQVVGLSGKTGRASGPHLHWTVMLNGTSVDPELFIGQAKAGR